MAFEVVWADCLTSSPWLHNHHTPVRQSRKPSFTERGAIFLMPPDNLDQADLRRDGHHGFRDFRDASERCGDGDQISPQATEGWAFLYLSQASSIGSDRSITC